MSVMRVRSMSRGMTMNARQKVPSACEAPVSTVDPVVFEDAFRFVLVPLPRGVWGRVRTVISLTESMILGRFRPGSGGRIIFNFNFVLKYGWV